MPLFRHESPRTDNMSYTFPLRGKQLDRLKVGDRITYFPVSQLLRHVDRVGMSSDRAILDHYYDVTLHVASVAYDESQVLQDIDAWIEYQGFNDEYWERSQSERWVTLNRKHLEGLFTRIIRKSRELARSFKRQ